ncbi:NADPH-dependent 2,4-dienoyl-CoA reductase/sulfur reductase-like enzyme [Lewinella marina]|uniref:FAD-dependent oxidoreductase n=1 Tax=Neolewinella marina TaxID=438751 RepID=A0A2G0CEH6_9BACT|nr:FAD/NAD(P)-binding oxidoreductase [Neolewinella marina]NJB87302.1 NADPH-dependent 2,4-dienoyl-CoA reductase/sulfur reductase-like enzyme [Neolewinella marina]PHK98378.1 FAD-dependent oxidoreductase [Neolewinella marina]
MHVAILGNGIAGITAARWLRKLSDDVRITVISAESDYFFSRTALMYVYMGHQRWEDLMPYEPFFWSKNRIELRRGYVEGVDVAAKTLHFSGGDSLAYDKLVLATGSAWNTFGWPGQDLQRVGGLVSVQDLEYLEKVTPEIQSAVVVGGGLIGIELAEMLHSRHIPVTLLVRESSYWSNVLPREESEMVSRHIQSRGIEVLHDTELQEIHDDGGGAAGAITTKSGRRIECQYVGLTAGVHPNIGFLAGNDAVETGKGILVDQYLRTSAPDVYAIGDCAELRQPRPGRKAIEAIWYTGRMMGETVAYTLLGRPVAYDPGIWFNSAKFVDLEYQVYGEVPAHGREGLATLYWEHPDGEKSVRINYEKDGGAVRGFNLMGIRYRQEVCEKWIANRAPIEEVLQNLGMANFDPELYAEYEADIVALYNQQTGSNLRLQKKRGLDAVLRFLNFKTRTPRAIARPDAQ